MINSLENELFLCRKQHYDKALLIDSAFVPQMFFWLFERVYTWIFLLPCCIFILIVGFIYLCSENYFLNSDLVQGYGISLTHQSQFCSHLMQSKCKDLE